VLNNLDLLQNFYLKSLICLSFSYLFGFFAIKKFIAFVKKKEIFKQPIRSDGPESHLKNKKNTPTMGGIFIILSTLTTNLLFVDLANPYIMPVLLVFTLFGLIGLIDDLMKVIYKNPNGFKGSVKIVIQFAIISVIFVWLGFIDEIHIQNKVFLPFFGGKWIYLGVIFYILFFTFVIVGTSNAVNLTDGLDGLVSFPAIINLICLCCLIFIISDQNFAKDFNVLYIKNSQELFFFCLSLIGAILSFLTFNFKPAKIFMGDVGSLAIGSSLGLIAIIFKQEFIFFIISLLFVSEACSVIIQVASYKTRKKRVFLMAPIHHHFEKKGWSENKVVKTFWFISVFFALIGMTIFYFI
jgi:phospho-N-acetylmuramoyl-pentapeptide-transferase